MLKKILKSILKIPENLYNHYMFWKCSPGYCIRPKINGYIYMVADHGAIVFGKNVRINSSLRSNPIGGSDKTVLFAEPGAQIRIGNNVGISNSSFHAAQCITIEDDVMIGGGCCIYDSDFHSISYGKRMQCPDPDIKTVPVLIKRGAFIGAHSIVLKGVTIGIESVIGAGSVVTKDIPDGEIWGGNPARFIKKIKKIN